MLTLEPEVKEEEVRYSIPITRSHNYAARERISQQISMQ